LNESPCGDGKSNIDKFSPRDAALPSTNRLGETPRRRSRDLR